MTINGIKVTLPKMIIFDQGHTLHYESDWDSRRGDAALLPYAVKNPGNCTLDDIRRTSDFVYGTHIKKIRDLSYDVGGRVCNKVVYDYLGLEFSLTPLEMECVFWDAASPGTIMPDADKLIDFINAAGIRSAVISNLLFSGDALARRLGKILPRNKFEFIMTSSDYIFRKPHTMMFEIAVRKSGLEPSQIWYCGDNPQADVEASSRAGMFPVWYDSPLPCHYRNGADERAPACPHIHVREHGELIDILERLIRDCE